MSSSPDPCHLTAHPPQSCNPSPGTGAPLGVPGSTRSHADPRDRLDPAAGTLCGLRDPRARLSLKRARGAGQEPPPGPPSPGRAGPQGARPLSLSFPRAQPPPGQPSPVQPGTPRYSLAHPGTVRHTLVRLGTAQLGSAMPQFSLAQCRRFGDQFVQFLRDTGREQESRRDELRSIYTQEFRVR